MNREACVAISGFAICALLALYAFSASTWQFWALIGIGVAWHFASAATEGI